MKTIYKALFVAILAAMAIQCTEEKFEESALQVSTQDFSNVYQTTASGSAYITINMDQNVTETGFCWSSEGVPTTADACAVSETTVSTGAYTVDITGLQPSTTYKGRAYVVASGTTYYGNVVEFTTRGIPTDGWCIVDSTPDVSVITASVVMQIADDGNKDILRYGVCYNTTGNPTIDDPVVESRGGSGFKAQLTDLLQGTKYYVKPFFVTADNNVIYGEQKSFTTLNFILSLEALPGFHAAYLFGQVYMDIDSPTTERGFVWSTSPKPTLQNGTKFVSGDSGNLVGSYQNVVGGLEKGTTYYARAYAVNASGTFYGSDIEFTTLTGEVLPGFSLDQMKFVEAGTFEMGNPNNDTEISPLPGNKTGYEPCHTVQITKDYYMSCYHVTNEQVVNFFNIYQGYWGTHGNRSWESPGIYICNSGGGSWSFSYSGNHPNIKYEVRPGYTGYPAGNVTWFGAYKFMEWLSAEFGVKCRLATEAEWEYAARGGKYSHGYEYAGSNDYTKVAFINSSKNTKVGTMQPNELGIYDMSGLAFDYCADNFDQNLYLNSVGKVSVDPYVPRTEQGAKVIRGGSYRHLNYAKVYFRGKCSNEQDCGAHSGFRIVMESLPDPSLL